MVNFREKISRYLYLFLELIQNLESLFLLRQVLATLTSNIRTLQALCIVPGFYLRYQSLITFKCQSEVKLFIRENTNR